MILNLFCLHDTISGDYGSPLSAVNEKVLIRTLKENLSQINHFEDYELFHIGIYNVETGEIKPIEKKFIIRLLDLKEVTKNG